MNARLEKITNLKEALKRAVLLKINYPNNEQLDNVEEHVKKTFKTHGYVEFYTPVINSSKLTTCPNCGVNL